MHALTPPKHSATAVDRQHVVVPRTHVDDCAGAGGEGNLARHRVTVYGATGVAPRRAADAFPCQHSVPTYTLAYVACCNVLHTHTHIHTGCASPATTIGIPR